AVNMVGSLFYGTLLGVFTLAFFFKRVGGTGAFVGMLVGEAAILSTARFTNISFLWYNLSGAADAESPLCSRLAPLKKASTHPILLHQLRIGVDPDARLLRRFDVPVLHRK